MECDEGARLMEALGALMAAERLRRFNPSVEVEHPGAGGRDVGFAEV